MTARKSLAWGRLRTILENPAAHAALVIDTPAAGDRLRMLSVPRRGLTPERGEKGSAVKCRRGRAAVSGAEASFWGAFIKGGPRPLAAKGKEPIGWEG